GNCNAERYETELKRRAELARKAPELPVFRNRVLTEKKKAEVLFRKFVPEEIIPIPFPGWFALLIDPMRSLMITDVSVVEDPSRTYNPCNNTGTPMGPWTFGKLMTEMANEPATGINPSDFVLHWLQQWTTDLPINGFTV